MEKQAGLNPAGAAAHPDTMDGGNSKAAVYNSIQYDSTHSHA